MGGIFDGEGSAGLYYNSKGNSLHLDISISASYEPTKLSIKNFLLQQTISSSFYKSKNPYGEHGGVKIQQWDSVAKFHQAILPFLIEKKRHMLIVGKIIDLHSRVKIEGRNYASKYIAEFDVLRHELHALANKGPKLSKQWLSV